MNPIREIIENYESNRQILHKALRNAGGDADMILNSTTWREVLITLAQNHISINATYLLPKAD